MSVQTLPTSIRISPEDLQAIDQMAAEHGIGRTQFLIGKALNRLGEIGLDARVDELERRIKGLEERAFGY